MSNEPDSPTCPTHGLYFQGSLPLTWREVEPPGEVDLHGLEHDNVHVLRTLFALEAHAVDSSDELPDAYAQTVARLDLKLNLLLDMVGHLFARQQLIPDSHLATLTPDAMRWQDSVAPSQSSLLRIELYCSKRLPQPLILHGRTIELTPQAEGWLVAAEFQNLGEAVREGLERFIFVQHRRAVSHSRRTKRHLF